MMMMEVGCHCAWDHQKIAIVKQVHDNAALLQKAGNMLEPSTQ